MSSNRIEREISETVLSVTNLEDKEATLTKNEMSFNVPIRLLPKGIKNGDSVVLNISSLWAHSLQKEKKAKELLNEILNN